MVKQLTAESSNPLHSLLLKKERESHALCQNYLFSAVRVVECRTRKHNLYLLDYYIERSVLDFTSRQSHALAIKIQTKAKAY